MVARLITPVLAAYALRGDSLVVHNVGGPIMPRFLLMFRWCVANRWKTIAAGVLFFVLSVACLFIIPSGFIPPEDFASSQLDIELPPGGTLEDTARVSQAAAVVLRKSPEVTDIVEFVGGGDYGEIRNAAIYVSLVPRSQRSITQKEWEQKMMPLLAQVPDGHVNFSQGGGGRDIQLYLTGEDAALVERTGHKVLDEMRALPDVRDAR